MNPVNPFFKPRIPGTIRPPSSPGYSQAQAGARPEAGKAGQYRKTDAGIIMQSPDLSGRSQLFGAANMNDNDGRTVAQNIVSFMGRAETTAAFATFEVTCPSSRIRVAFGVVQPSVAMGPQDRYEDNNSSQPFKWVNVVPGVQTDKFYAARSNSTDPDKSMVVYGQPLYPYPDTQVAGEARNIIDPRDIIYGGYDGSAANSGGRATSNGSGWPFSFEDQSNANVYRVFVGVIALANVVVGMPVYAWATWEVVDPRSAEDTEALLSQCYLKLAPPVMLPGP